MALLFAACADPAADLSKEGDELVFGRRYLEASQRYESALIECGERTDADALELRRKTLYKLGEVRQYYLDDAQGALRAYRTASDLHPGSDEAFEAKLRIVRLLRDRMGDAGAAATELSALIEAFPGRAGSDRLTLELAQLSFQAGRFGPALVTAERLRVEAAKSAAPEAAALRRDAIVLIAAIHEAEGRDDHALSAYQDLLEMPLDLETAASIRFDVAHCHERMGNIRGALEQYELAKNGSKDEGLIASRMEQLKRRLAKAGKPSAPQASLKRSPSKRYVGGIRVVR